jgi:hypothetical protein
MRSEFNATPGVVLKCAVLLVLIFGIAWIGVSGELSASGVPPTAAAQTAATAESYRRTVFEERRKRYIEAYPESHVAREAPSLKQRDANSDGGYVAYQND